MAKLILSIAIILGGYSFTDDNFSTPTNDYELAAKLLKVALAHNEKPKFNDILQIIKTSKNLETNCLPGIFHKEDYIAIAWVESRFDPYVIGNAREVGVWQVLEWKQLLPQMKSQNPFSIDVNGAMMCEVLKQKYSIYHNYKKTIRAYNGYSLIKEWTYYNQVQRFKKEIK